MSTTQGIDIDKDMLLWALKRSRKTPEEVTTKNIPFSSWVKGDRKPTLKQLTAFAKRVCVPIGMLFLNEPPIEELPITDFRTIKNEELREPSSYLIATLDDYQFRQEWYSDYLQAYGAEPIEFIGSYTLESSIQQVAQKMRVLLQLENLKNISSYLEMRTHIKNKLEEIGILVGFNGVVGSNSRQKLDIKEFRGFSLSNKYAPLIFVNNADTIAAQIFTLIHELAHLLLGSSGLTNLEVENTSIEETHSSQLVNEEKWCSSVAAEVLVPLESMKKLVKEQSLNEDTLNIEDIERLAQQYKVSSLVIIQRLYKCNFFSSYEKYNNYYETLENHVRTKMSSSQKKKGGNFYPAQINKYGTAFAQAVIESTYMGQTSYLDAYDLLGVKGYQTYKKLAQHIGIEMI